MSRVPATIEREPRELPRAPRGPSNFRENDIKRTVRAMRAAGLAVGRIDIEGGRISIIPAVEVPPLIDDGEDVVL